MFCCLSSLKWRVSVSSCLTFTLSFFLSACVMLSRSQIVHFDIIIVSVLLDHMTLLFFRNIRWLWIEIDFRSIFVGLLPLLYNIFVESVLKCVIVIIAIFFSLLCA